jgi:tRNA pseudouridine38-40 synthase
MGHPARDNQLLMAHYQVILAYDGTRYAGFQRQANAITIQDQLESALRKIGWQGRSIRASGRTDKGVHALGQVVTFEMDWAHGENALQSALNASLSLDISAISVSQVAPGFHPRKDALTRHYRYSLVCLAVRNPLRERYAWRVWPPPETDRLRRAAGLLVGRLDFAAFGTPPVKGGTTVRDVKSACWAEEEERLVFDVVADAFLYHMVRRMVYIQLAAAEGRLSEQELTTSLETGMPLSATGIAPPQGLVLVGVTYPLEMRALSVSSEKQEKNNRTEI